jgi:hypothetical protein
VIEPRNRLIVGAFAFKPAGAVALPCMAWGQRSCRGPRAGHRHSKVPQEPGRSGRCRSGNAGRGAALPQSSRPGSGRRAARERTQAHGSVTVRRRKRSVAGRAVGSRITPWYRRSRGTGPQEPGGGTGVTGQGVVGGQQGRTTESWSPVNGMPTNSVRGCGTGDCPAANPWLDEPDA